MPPCPAGSTPCTHPVRRAATVKLSPLLSSAGCARGNHRRRRASRHPASAGGRPSRRGESAAGRLHADAVVLAAGVATRNLARTAGVRAPILPVKGCAATVPVTAHGGAPTVGGVLESQHVAYSRMGDRLRLSTGAEIGRTDHDVTEPMKQQLKRAGEELFPGALDWASATYRAEHRPMTPTGLPMIGPTRAPGLYLDAAHGSLGWTQAAGSADLLTHLIGGKSPPIDPTPFLPTRPTRRQPAPPDVPGLCPCEPPPKETPPP